MPRRRRRSPAAARNRHAAQTLKYDMLSRTTLGKELTRYIKANDISQTFFAMLVGDAATQISRLCNGHFAEFSADRLLGFMLKSGYQGRLILIRPKFGTGQRRARKIEVEITGGKLPHILT